MLHQVLDPCSGKQGGPSDSIHGPLAISLCFWAEIPMKKGEIGMQTGQHTVGGKMTSVLGLGGGVVIWGGGVLNRSEFPRSNLSFTKQILIAISKKWQTIPGPQICKSQD